MPGLSLSSVRAALHSLHLNSGISTEAGELPRAVSLATSRAVLRLAGPEVLPFLQGILTNDVSSLDTRSSKPVYAALLNAQGRFLHDLFLHARADNSGGQVVLADTDRDSAPGLISLLRKYRLRAKVDIADVSSELCPWVSYGGPVEESDWPFDPRLRVLGSRTIAELSPHQQDSTDVQHYRHWRFQHGVAEGSEMPFGHAVPLEYNLDGLGAISYTKGCYIGQELIARAHYQGIVRKRLMPATILPPADGSMIVPGADLTADGSTRSVGKIIAASQDVVLVLVRLKAALLAAGGQSSLYVAGTNAVLRPECPSWWPESWRAEATELSSARV